MRCHIYDRLIYRILKFLIFFVCKLNGDICRRHRYNYDHASTSGESSIDEFIDDENDEETDSDEEDLREELQLTEFKQVSFLTSTVSPVTRYKIQEALFNVSYMIIRQH